MKTDRIDEQRERERGSPRVPTLPTRDVAPLVGTTPVARYATWDDHRRAIRLAAEEARARRAR